MDFAKQKTDEVSLMSKTSNPNLTANAKELRKHMTKEEQHLWYDFLKSLPLTIHRQKVIGNYIVDFYCAKAKLVIELDGSQHYEASGQAADNIRDNDLRSLGLRVLRYSNLEINQNFDAVCADILQHTATSSVTSGDTFPTQGEGMPGLCNSPGFSFTPFHGILLSY